jgi:hypothetical protein
MAQRPAFVNLQHQTAAEFAEVRRVIEELHQLELSPQSTPSSLHSPSHVTSPGSDVSTSSNSSDSAMGSAALFQTTKFEDLWAGKDSNISLPPSVGSVPLLLGCQTLNEALYSVVEERMCFVLVDHCNKMGRQRRKGKGKGSGKSLKKITSVNSPTQKQLDYLNLLGVDCETGTRMKSPFQIACFIDDAVLLGNLGQLEGQWAPESWICLREDGKACNDLLELAMQINAHKCAQILLQWKVDVEQMKQDVSRIGRSIREERLRRDLAAIHAITGAQATVSQQLVQEVRIGGANLKKQVMRDRERSLQQAQVAQRVVGKVGSALSKRQSEKEQVKQIVRDLLFDA